MAWRRPGDKPLSNPVMVRLQTHMCVTRPQWVNTPYLFATSSPHNSRKRRFIIGFWVDALIIPFIITKLLLQIDKMKCFYSLTWWLCDVMNVLMSWWWPHHYETLSALLTGCQFPLKQNCDFSLLLAWTKWWTKVAAFSVIWYTMRLLWKSWLKIFALNLPMLISFLIVYHITIKLSEPVGTSSSFTNINKANLRDLIAATGLAILLKLDSNRRFFSPCDLEIWWMTSKNNRAPLLY